MRVHGAGSQAGPPPTGQREVDKKADRSYPSVGGSYRFRPVARPVAPEAARGPEQLRPQTRTVTNRLNQETPDDGRVAE